MAEKRKKTPTRTCCACGAQGDKKSLARIVRTPAGIVRLDPTGREAGRGAYLCRDAACLARARKHHRLDKALRITLNEDDYDRLERDFEALTADGEGTVE